MRPETLRHVVNKILATRDEMWWTFTPREEQIERLRDLFFDPTTDPATLAVIVDHLRKLIDDAETLQVYCLEIEPLFRPGERLRRSPRGRGRLTNAVARLIAKYNTEMREAKHRRSPHVVAIFCSRQTLRCEC